ncbi:putative metal-binding protein [Thioflavicoccus mobilis 8321]|uniref:Putative metal-binding protein n=1 Tax=Thioflavicoccus mobilis 8321 TaxID=765912 RepID=L0GY10_9GAMM|nr:DUF411 domain-containing protein [Thioflavicoccus mobilis]AGA90856.1 putative metal-binding protein [Thioflavicoccus mobilis 8321]
MTKAIPHRTTLGLAILIGLTGPAVAGLPPMTVYKSPTCGCCTAWAEHLRDNGLEVRTVDLSDLGQVKAMAGVAPAQASCHTAMIDGYVIEGHVPADDIKRLLADHPPVRGLTVPGMPLGSPGMEGPRSEHYQVLTIDADGHTAVFAEH